MKPHSNNIKQDALFMLLTSEIFVPALELVCSKGTPSVLAYSLASSSVTVLCSVRSHLFPTSTFSMSA